MPIKLRYSSLHCWYISLVGTLSKGWPLIVFQMYMVKWYNQMDWIERPKTNAIKEIFWDMLYDNYMSCIKDVLDISSSDSLHTLKFLWFTNLKMKNDVKSCEIFGPCVAVTYWNM